VLVKGTTYDNYDMVCLLLVDEGVHGLFARFHIRVSTNYAQGNQTSYKVKPNVNIDVIMQ
jgi:hypothetical protein